MIDLHIGLIPDGNRRYAKKDKISIDEIYAISFNKIIHIIETLLMNKDEKWQSVNRKFNIKELSVYVCSIENLKKRPENEVQNILKMIKKFIDYYYSNDWIEKFGVKINIIGDYYSFTHGDDLQKIADETANNNGLTLNLAIAYDPKKHIYQCVKSTDSVESANNAIGSDIDLVIRTGFERRTSGFFPWQTMYAEWFFLDKYFPELSVEDIQNALDEYVKRERRFGK